MKLSVFFVIVLMISCNNQVNKTVDFVQEKEYKNDSILYSFTIRNMEDKNLLILIPNIYIKKKDCDKVGLITGTMLELGKNSPFCNNILLSDSICSVPMFNLYLKKITNDPSLIDELLKKTKDKDIREDFRLLASSTDYKYPILLFIKANSKIEYKFYSLKVLPEGEYFIYYDLPKFIINSKKYKQWITTLNQIDSIDTYHFHSIEMKTNKLLIQVK